ncbi:hypothetical protein PENSPDRAFT_737252 [Peniophora sp. CONT]|nr:hypothetical protein PENSPDRAFT_737252 [Peniophora sp. CONT]
MSNKALTLALRNALCTPVILSPGQGRYTCAGHNAQPPARSERASQANCHISSIRICHRLILTSLGSSISQYENSLQLLRAVEDIVLVHRCIVEKGILLYGIGAADVILLESLSDEATGYIIDLDTAEESRQVLGDRSPSTLLCRVVPARIVAVKGTAPFMAADVVSAVNLGSPTPLHYGPEHDLESLLYVLGHAILNHYLNDPSTPASVLERLQEIYRETFVNPFDDGNGIFDTPRLKFKHGFFEHHPIAWFHFLYQEVARAIDHCARTGGGLRKANEPPHPTEILRNWMRDIVPRPMFCLLVQLSRKFRPTQEELQAENDRDEWTFAHAPFG